MVPRTRTDLGQYAAQRHQLEQHCAVAGMEPCRCRLAALAAKTSRQREYEAKPYSSCGV